MNTSQEQNGKATRNIDYFMNTKNWWGPLTFILIISLAGVGLIGYQTYIDAPPMSGFKDSDQQVVISQKDIESGQRVFHKYALMEYGSFFGDGAQRGPDFTAEALHLLTIKMVDYYVAELRNRNQTEPGESDLIQIREQVKKELKQNRLDPTDNLVVLSSAQVSALKGIVQYYLDFYIDKNRGHGFPPIGYIKDRAEVAALSYFFFWGAWVCVTQRPGANYSYTHNWPFDPGAGNNPTSPVIVWSVLGLLAFVLTCGIVLYFIGQYNQLPNKFFKPPVRDRFTIERVSKFSPTATQRATFKFFVVAILLW